MTGCGTTPAAADATASARPGGVRPKTAADENFPVGSWLIRRDRRAHVAVFYAFARAADDVADDPNLSTAEKLRSLAAFEAGLSGAVGDGIPDQAVAMRNSLRDTGLDDVHCRHLLQAFRQDARMARYPDWPALLDYCGLSAAPIGRYLLDLHGEGADPRARRSSDALCAALQVLNHLQDCRDDLRRLDRVYIPQDLLRRHGADERAIAGAAAGPALRAVLDEALLLTERLLDEARELPRRIASRRLAGESAAILALARRLLARLRREDPIAGPVRLGRWDFLAAACAGFGRAARPTTAAARGGDPAEAA